MEKKLDKNLQWRKYVNKKSKEYFKAIYQKSNCSIFLRIPSFKYVFQYRKKQELDIPKNKNWDKVHEASATGRCLGKKIFNIIYTCWLVF